MYVYLLALYGNNFARRCIFLKWQEEINDIQVLNDLRDRGYDVSPFPLVDWGGHITESQQAFPLMGQRSAVVSALITRIRETLPITSRWLEIAENNSPPLSMPQRRGEAAAENLAPTSASPGRTEASATASSPSSSSRNPAPFPAPTTPYNVPTANATVEPAAANETTTATPPVAVAEATAAHDSPVPSINNNHANASVVIHVHIPTHAAAAPPAPHITSTSSSSASPSAAAVPSPPPIAIPTPTTSAAPSATSVPPPPVPPTASTTSSASSVPPAATPAPTAATAAQRSSEAAAAAAATALTFLVHDLIEGHAEREGQVAGLLWRGNLRCFPEITHGAVVERVEEPSGGRILVTKNNSFWGNIGAFVGANVRVTLKDAVTNADVAKFRLGTKYNNSIAAQIEVLWFDVDHVRFERQCCGEDLGACVCLALF